MHVCHGKSLLVEKGSFEKIKYELTLAYQPPSGFHGLLADCLGYDSYEERNDPIHKKYIMVDVATALLEKGANLEKHKPLPNQCPELIMLYRMKKFDSVCLYLEHGKSINPNIRDEACGGSILDIGLSRLVEAVKKKLPAEDILSLIKTDITTVLFGNKTKPTVSATDIIGYLQNFRKPFMVHKDYVNCTGPEYDVLPILVKNLQEGEIKDGDLFEMCQWAITYASLDGVMSLYSDEMVTAHGTTTTDVEKALLRRNGNVDITRKIAQFLVGKGVITEDVLKTLESKTADGSPSSKSAYKAHGSFGCVFSHVSRCKDEVTTADEKTISKIFLNREDFESEKNASEELLKRIPPTTVPFIVNVVGTCEDIPLKDLEADVNDIKLCDWKHLGTDTVVHKIDYENGGVDLYNLFNTGNDSDNPGLLVEVWGASGAVFEGLFKMVAKPNRIYHSDIKPQNLTYRRSDNRLFLIDWGCATFGAERGEGGSAGFRPPETYIKYRYSGDSVTKAKIIPSTLSNFLRSLLLLLDQNPGLKRKIIKWIQMNYIWDPPQCEHGVHYIIMLGTLYNQLNSSSSDIEREMEDRGDTYSWGMTLLVIIKNSGVAISYLAVDRPEYERRWMMGVLDLCLDMTQHSIVDRVTASLAYRRYLHLQSPEVFKEDQKAKAALLDARAKELESVSRMTRSKSPERDTSERQGAHKKPRIEKSEENYRSSNLRCHRCLRKRLHPQLVSMNKEKLRHEAQLSK